MATTTTRLTIQSLIHQIEKRIEASKGVDIIFKPEELPFGHFLECISKSNLDCLVRSGTATANAKYANWLLLLAGYHDAAGSKNTEVFIRKAGLAMAANGKIFQVETLIATVWNLSRAGHIEQVGPLFDCLVFWDYPRPAVATLEEDLLSVNELLDTERRYLTGEREQFEHEQRLKGPRGQAETRNRYITLFNRIEESAGRTIDSATLNTFEFATLVKQYKNQQ